MRLLISICMARQTVRIMERSVSATLWQKYVRIIKVCIVWGCTVCRADLVWAFAWNVDNFICFPLQKMLEELVTMDVEFYSSIHGFIHSRRSTNGGNVLIHLSHYMRLCTMHCTLGREWMVVWMHVFVSEPSRCVPWCTCTFTFEVKLTGTRLAQNKKSWSVELT